MSICEPVKLSDYRQYPFLIPKIEIDISIYIDHAIIDCLMKVQPLNEVSVPLVLKGTDLQLESISLDGLDLPQHLFEQNSSELIISCPGTEPFDLNITCKIFPFNNTSLEGFYLSSDILTTQCEAEGFRRICFHPDRPDVLSRYIVRINADINRYPVLLSNGNQIKSKRLIGDPSRHMVEWEDPFPKPSYLFAVVAGCLKKVTGTYQTKSGRKIKIGIYVEPGDEKYTKHAIKSLKLAMEWDENIYGLEYDLDEYNIVAIRHFNMGAMENKSLNIFNSKLVLADAKTATDAELQRIESVIAHEYFHNWTGNRITCRDWFQLSLKEGLTVFRDQCFTSDQHSVALKRIEDASYLRSTQFREDMGPTAHAVKPVKYFSIDNFYTTTIYEKGAELIRMLHILLGRKYFMSGMEIYFKRYDGCAVTTEDLVESIIEGAVKDKRKLNFDIDQFTNWYYQAGTPRVEIQRKWNQEKGSLTIRFKQFPPEIEGEKCNNTFVIPIAYALIDNEGINIRDDLLVLDSIEKEITINGLAVDKPSPSFSGFRGFSAPVRYSIDLSIDEYLHLFRFDNDPFSRWDAGQILMSKLLLSKCNSSIDNSLLDKLISTFRYLISTLSNSDPGLLSSLLCFPSLSELEDLQDEADPISLYNSIIYFQTFFGKELSESLHDSLCGCRLRLTEDWPRGQGERQFTSLAWRWLSLAGDTQIIDEALAFVNGDSMTLARSALLSLQPIECVQRSIAMQTFYERWKDNQIILDTWFSIEASIHRNESLEIIEQLLVNPRFDYLSPNSIRAVLGGLSRNVKTFHAEDGSGYNFMADKLISLDKRNPITASRLMKVFSRWRSYVGPQKEQMRNVIKRMFESDLSENSREVINLLRN